LGSNEATKTRGGDLGFFSQLPVPPDFFAAIIKMRVGEISKPIRTRLGFHIIQLTDREPPRRMTFDEAREEIGFMFE
jgi:parvulin-like peptidyl-prolyl isomerase